MAGFRDVDGPDESPVAHRSASPRRPLRRRLPLIAAVLPLAALVALAALAALAATTLWMGSTAAPAATAPAAAATPAATATTTTTTYPAGATPADKWVINAITAEQRFGSVGVVGKISQGKSKILLELRVNSDGEGGGEFVQDGNLIKIERVGPLLYFNAPAKFWATHATAAQTQTYGGSGSSSPRSTPASLPSTSSSMRPTSSWPPSRATRHRSPSAAPRRSPATRS